MVNIITMGFLFCGKTTFSRSVWFTSQGIFKLSLGDVLQLKVADKLVTRQRAGAVGTNSKALRGSQTTRVKLSVHSENVWTFVLALYTRSGRF